MSHDPGVSEGIARTAAADQGAIPALRATGGARIRIGTASWTDPTMIAPGVFYPDGVARPETRLRHYASRFPLVEVDSSYYAIPARQMGMLWAERTPAEFMFNVKAHALMTGQPTEMSRLPKTLRESLPRATRDKARIYAKDLPPEAIDEVWRLFRDAMAPLQAEGKLGAILLQYPRWVRPSPASAELIEDARARLGGLRGAVEFRHRDWLADGTRERTLALLERNELSYVCVDAPQGMESSVPPLTAVTNPALSIVRFHGRRVDHWERPANVVSERFRYLYDADELSEWLPKIDELASRTRELHLVFNNCYANYGTTNAVEIAELLRRARLVT